MKVVLQKVNSARLTSENYVSQIDFGLLATVGVSRFDTEFDAKYLAKKIANLRMFKDDSNKTNLSLIDKKGDILVVSNFTLQANPTRGTRPDFSHAAESEYANNLYLLLVDELKKYVLGNVQIGSFGNHMQIETILNGPFTIIIESEGRSNE